MRPGKAQFISPYFGDRAGRLCLQANSAARHRRAFGRTDFLQAPLAGRKSQSQSADARDGFSPAPSSRGWRIREWKTSYRRRERASWAGAHGGRTPSRIPSESRFWRRDEAMNIHEYQAKAVLRGVRGAPVSRGEHIRSGRGGQGRQELGNRFLGRQSRRSPIGAAGQVQGTAGRRQGRRRLAKSVAEVEALPEDAQQHTGDHYGWTGRQSSHASTSGTFRHHRDSICRP